MCNAYALHGYLEIYSELFSSSTSFVCITQHPIDFYFIIFFCYLTYIQDFAIYIRIDYLVMSHIRFSTIQKSFEFKPICISICDNIADLSDYCRKYKYTNQIADNRKNVSGNWRIIRENIGKKIV